MQCVSLACTNSTWHYLLTGLCVHCVHAVTDLLSVVAGRGYVNVTAVIKGIEGQQKHISGLICKYEHVCHGAFPWTC